MPQRTLSRPPSGKLLALFLLAFILTAITVLFTQGVSPAPAQKGCQAEKCYKKILQSDQASNYWPLQKNLKPAIGKTSLRLRGQYGITNKSGRSPGQGTGYWKLAPGTRKSALVAPLNKVAALSFWVRDQGQAGTVVSKGVQKATNKSEYWALSVRKGKIFFAGQKSNRAWLCPAGRKLPNNDWALLSLVSGRGGVDVWLNGKKAISCKQAAGVRGPVFFGALIAESKKNQEIQQPTPPKQPPAGAPEAEEAPISSGPPSSTESKTDDPAEEDSPLPAGDFADQLPEDGRQQELGPEENPEAAIPGNILEIDPGPPPPALNSAQKKTILQQKISDPWAGDLARIAVWKKNPPSSGMIAVIHRSGREKIEVRTVLPQEEGTTSSRSISTRAPSGLWSSGGAGSWEATSCNGSAGSSSGTTTLTGSGSATNSGAWVNDTYASVYTPANFCAASTPYLEMTQSGAVAAQRSRRWRFDVLEPDPDLTILNNPRVFLIETKSSRFQSVANNSRPFIAIEGRSTTQETGTTDGARNSAVRDLPSTYPTSSGPWIRDSNQNYTITVDQSTMGLTYPLHWYTQIRLHAGLRCFNASNNCANSNARMRLGPLHVYYASGPGRRNEPAVEIAAGTPDSSFEVSLIPIIALGKTDLVIKCLANSIPGVGPYDEEGQCTAAVIAPQQQISAPGGLEYTQFTFPGATTQVFETTCIKTNNTWAWRSATGQSTSTPCPIRPNSIGFQNLFADFNTRNSWLLPSIGARESAAVGQGNGRLALFNSDDPNIGRVMIDDTLPSISWTSGASRPVSTTGPQLAINTSDTAGIARVVWGLSSASSPAAGECTPQETPGATPVNNTQTFSTNPTSTSSARTFSALANGSCYTFRVQAEDRSGTWGGRNSFSGPWDNGTGSHANTSYRTYLIDTTPPAAGSISCSGTQSADRDVSGATNWFTATPSCSSTVSTTNNGFTNGRSKITAAQFQRSSGTTCATPGSWSNQTTTLGTGTISRSASAAPSTAGRYCLRAAGTSEAGLTTAEQDRPTTEIGLDTTNPTITPGSVPSSPQAGTITFGASTVTDSTSLPRRVQIQYKLSSAGSGAWTLLPNTACANQQLAATATSHTGTNCSFDTTNLADGEYDFRVRGLDSAGREITSILNAKPSSAGTSLVIRNSITASLPTNSSPSDPAAPVAPASGTTGADSEVVFSPQNINVLAGKSFSVQICVDPDAPAESFRQTSGVTFPSGYPLRVQPSSGPTTNLSKTCSNSPLASNLSAADQAVSVPFTLRQNIGWSISPGSYQLPLKIAVSQ